MQDLWKSRINDEKLNMVYNLEVQLDLELPEITNYQSDEVSSRHVSSNISAPPHSHSDHQEAVEDLVCSQSSSVDHDYCAMRADSKPSSLVAQKLCTIRDKVRSRSTLEANQEETVLKLLEYTEYLIGGEQAEERLVEVVMTLLQSHLQEFNIYSSPLLQALAGWVGHKFHSSNSSISQQVEGFKMRHIEHITDLPPAEELAAELFPEAMRSLLINWMGLGEEAATRKRLSEYPIVLLILEFANHNLITGVAHVLYSSLISR